MLNNNYVRIAIVIVLVIILYYLVITLARSTAAADELELPPTAPAASVGGVSAPRA